MRKEIPSRVEITCDCCEKLITRGEGVAEGALIIKQHALDWHGIPCADGSQKFDLCDRCLRRVILAIESVKKE